jgi:hypothetical protein
MLDDDLERLELALRGVYRLALGGLRWLGYGNPIVSEAALTTAIPTMPIVIMLAVQFRTGGGCVRRVPQRDRLAHHDGGFHRPDKLNG